MEGAGSDSVTSPLRSGIIAAVATLLIDQASKLWLLHVFDLGHRYPPRVPITPFFDLELAWNIGISFGWLQNDSQIVQLGLMAVKALAVVALAIWMARSHTLLATIALGLIIGGAIGNAIDRLAYGAVVDFALFHVDIGGNPYYWYVFNLADSAIVAGVIALLYDSLVGVSAAKAP
jgi:signal peptidase II